MGRTARAGRSGRSFVFVTQYDVEQFQKIEKAIGLQMTVYPTEEQLVLVMLDRVSEAQRIATKEAKESANTTTGTKRKRKDGDEQEIDTDHALFVKKKKVYKGNKNKKAKK